MSRQNKVNKGNYSQKGRLTPDDMAREREKMSATSPDRVKNQQGPKRKGAERGSTRGRSAPEE